MNKIEYIEKCDDNLYRTKQEAWSWAFNDKVFFAAKDKKNVKNNQKCVP